MGKDGQNSKRITITFPTDTYETLKEFADEWDISIAEVVRLAVGGNLERYLGNVRYVNSREANVIANNQKIINDNICGVFRLIQGMRNELRRIGINYNQEIRLLNIKKKREEYEKKKDWMPDLPEAYRNKNLEDLNRQEDEIKRQTSRFDQNAVRKLLKQFDASAGKVGDALCRFQK